MCKGRRFTRNLRLAWSTHQVLGRLELHSKTLIKTKKQTSDNKAPVPQENLRNNPLKDRVFFFKYNRYFLIGLNVYRNMFSMELVQLCLYLWLLYLNLLLLLFYSLFFIIVNFLSGWKSSIKRMKILSWDICSFTLCAILHCVEVLLGLIWSTVNKC